jgi:hypothetical protein
MAVRKVIKNGVIKYVRVKEDNTETPIEKDHQDKDLEIKRLEAIIEILESRIKQLETDKPKEESSDVDDVGAVAAASTYDCYK